MTRLAILDLEVPGSKQVGRAFLDQRLLETIKPGTLAEDLGRRFVQEDDKCRMELIEHLMREADVVQAVVYPGESSPPEYHAYLRDPKDPEAPLFACVLAPLAVISMMVRDAPHIVFETAILQAMGDDTSPSAMVTALSSWAQRVWPGIELPDFAVQPWPANEAELKSEVTSTIRKEPPPGAQVTLRDVSDYPTADELRSA